MIELNKLLKQLQNINLGRFSKINKAYVIGDLHGDLNKFLLFLKSINIINSSSFQIDYDSYDLMIALSKAVLHMQHPNPFGKK